MDARLVRSARSTTEGTSSPSARVWRWFALGGVVAPATFLLASIIFGVVRPDYSPVRQPISDLGRGHDAWMMRAVFILFGPLIAAFAASFTRQFRPAHDGGWATRSGVLLALSGAGVLGGGVFTEYRPGDTVPLHGVLHGVSFLVALGSLTISLFMIGPHLRADSAWRAYGRYTMLTARTTLVLLALDLAAAIALSGVGGLAQRCLLVEAWAWYAVIGWQLFVRGASGSGR